MAAVSGTQEVKLTNAGLAAAHQKVYCQLTPGGESLPVWCFDCARQHAYIGCGCCMLGWKRTILWCQRMF